MATASPILNPGDVLDGFRVEALIGYGSTAAVYRAEQLSLGRPVALKVLSYELSHDEAFRERFRREGKHLARFEHPNIVPVHESGEQDGLLYLAMRMVEGTNLAERLIGGGVDADEAVAILGPIAGALDAAHAQGLVHRDVKPQNILITVRGHPYLADFGVAKGSNTHSITATGRFVGTVNYASPEQIRGAPLTPASDIYALAAVLYHCLTGEVPYRHESHEAIMQAHLYEPPPQLPGGSGEHGGLDAVIARGMAKDPGARYASARELLDAATRAVSHMPPARRRAVPAFPPPAVRSSNQTHPAGSHPIAEPTVTDQRRPAERAPESAATPTPRWRSPAATASAGLLAVAAAVGVIVLATSGGHKAVAHPETLNLTASLAPVSPARHQLVALRTRSPRSLSGAELGLAVADAQSADLIARLPPVSAAHRPAVTHLIASLRREAATLSELAKAIHQGDGRAYADGMAHIPTVEGELTGTLSSLRTLGFEAAALLPLNAHSLAPAPTHKPPTHHKTRAPRVATEATTSSQAPPAGSGAAAPAAVAPPASGYTPPTHQAAPAPSHATHLYGPTVVAPPAE